MGKRNIFQLPLAHLYNGILSLVLDLPGHIFRHADLSRTRQRLNPRGDVYTITMDVIAHVHYITNVQSNSKIYSSIGRFISISFMKRSLYFNRAIGSFYGAIEFNEKGISRRFNFLPFVLFKKRPEDFSMLFQEFKGKRFILLRKCAVSGNVSKHYGRKTSHGGFGIS